MMRRLFLGLAMASTSLACSNEFTVEFQPRTTLYEGMVLDTNYIELIEGQSLAFQVTAYRNGEVLDDKIQIQNTKSSAFRAQDTYAKKEEGQRTFAVIAHAPGSGQVSFLVGKKERVITADVLVRPREDWVSSNQGDGGAEP